MRKIELLLISIFLLGTVIRLIQFPGGMVLSSISLTTLALFYFFLSFAFFNNIELKKIFSKNSYSGLTWMQMVSTVLFGISLANIVEGFLYRNLFKPGSEILYIGGLIFSILSIIPVLLTKEQIRLKRRRIKHYSFVLILAAFGLITPTESFIDLYHSKTPDYANALKSVYKDPSNLEAQKYLWEVKQKMDIEKRQRMHEKSSR